LFSRMLLLRSPTLRSGVDRTPGATCGGAIGGRATSGPLPGGGGVAPVDGRKGRPLGGVAVPLGDGEGVEPEPPPVMVIERDALAAEAPVAVAVATRVIVPAWAVDGMRTSAIADRLPFTVPSPWESGEVLAPDAVSRSTVPRAAARAADTRIVAVSDPPGDADPADTERSSESFGAGGGFPGPGAGDDGPGDFVGVGLGEGLV
jgi:hypothetical protein